MGAGKTLSAIKVMDFGFNVRFIFSNPRQCRRSTRSLVRGLWLERDQSKATFTFWSAVFSGFTGDSV
jgi:hypothetical protein